MEYTTGHFLALMEVLTLSNITVMLAEWIPMGHNFLGLLHDRLGVKDTVEGGLFTCCVDETPGTVHEMFLKSEKRKNKDENLHSYILIAFPFSFIREHDVFTQPAQRR